MSFENMIYSFIYCAYNPDVEGKFFSGCERLSSIVLVPFYSWNSYTLYKVKNLANIYPETLANSMCYCCQLITIHLTLYDIVNCSLYLEIIKLLCGL